MRTIKERKLAYFEHIMRNQKYELLQLVMQGRWMVRKAPEDDEFHGYIICVNGPERHLLNYLEPLSIR